MDAAQLRIKARLLRDQTGNQAAQQGGGLLSAISSFWGGGSGSNAGSYSGGTGLQSSSSHRQELRWRASPDVLVTLATRSKMAVQASGINVIRDLIDKLGHSLPTFLSVLSLLFPQPRSSQPSTPDDNIARQSDDARAKSTVVAASHHADALLAGDTGGSSNYSPASVFFLELAISSVTSSPERAPVIWPSIERAMQRMLEYADVLHHFSLERAVSGLLSMAVKILECCSNQESVTESTAPLLEMLERILRCLGLLRDARDSTFDAVTAQLAVGIERLVDTDAKVLLSVSTNWDIVRLLLKRLAHTQDAALVPTGGDTARRSLAVLVEIVILLKCGAIEPAVYFADVLDTLSAFMPSDRALLASSSPTLA
ncbi:hypothetical protein IWW38_004576, partial [Coemansia aciculifera]